MGDCVIGDVGRVTCKNVLLHVRAEEAKKITILFIRSIIYMDEVTQPPAAPSNNKIWYLAGGVVVLLLIGWFLTRGAASRAGVNVDRSTDGSTTYTNDEGSVTVGANKMPDNWPSDAPENAAGSSITWSGSSNPQTGSPGAGVQYTVKASVQSVVDHYKSKLQSAGWTVRGSANVGGATVLSATKDTRTFGAYIVDGGGGQVSETAAIEM